MTDIELFVIICIAAAFTVTALLLVWGGSA